MKMNKKFKVLVLTSFFVCLVFSIIFLAGTALAGCDTKTEICFENPWGMTTAGMDPRLLAGSILRIALGLLGSLFLVMVTVGGYIWIFSGGNKEKFKKGKDLLVWSVAGVAVVLASYGILDWVMTDVFEYVGGITQEECVAKEPSHVYVWRDGRCYDLRDLPDAEHTPAEGAMEPEEWAAYLEGECASECRVQEKFPLFDHDTYVCECLTEEDICALQGSDYFWSTLECCVYEPERGDSWVECFESCLSQDPEVFNECTYECRCECDGVSEENCPYTAGCTWIKDYLCMGVPPECAGITDDPDECWGTPGCSWIEYNGHCADS